MQSYLALPDASVANKESLQVKCMSYYLPSNFNNKLFGVEASLGLGFDSFIVFGQTFQQHLGRRD